MLTKRLQFYLKEKARNLAGRAAKACISSAGLRNSTGVDHAQRHCCGENGKALMLISGTSRQKGKYRE
jgi:hypothetical protein